VTAPPSVVSRLKRYFASVGDHASGSVEIDVLERLEDLVGPTPLAYSVETGCGKTTITVDALIAILRTLPAGKTELGCHPGLRRDSGGMYVLEREQEVAVLCDPRVRAALDSERIELISFRAFADAAGA